MAQGGYVVDQVRAGAEQPIVVRVTHREAFKTPMKLTPQHEILVANGDEVTEGQLLARLEADGEVTEVKAPAAGRITIRRPVSDGYMIEHIEIFEAVVPSGLEPVNRDGEVDRFEALMPAELIPRLKADAFTLEAALILIEALQRRGHLAQTPAADPTRS